MNQPSDHQSLLHRSGPAIARLGAAVKRACPRSLGSRSPTDQEEANQIRESKKKAHQELEETKTIEEDMEKTGRHEEGRKPRAGGPVTDGRPRPAVPIATRRGGRSSPLHAARPVSRR